jgi:hypothetical protein
MSQETEVKLGRGRPRPEEAIQRDASVLKLLKSGPLTRNQLRDATGLTGTIVYLSLSRLRREGKVKLCQGTAGNRVWSTDVSGPCP